MNNAQEARPQQSIQCCRSLHLLISSHLHKPSGPAHVTSQPPSSRSFLLHALLSLLVSSMLRLSRSRTTTNAQPHLTSSNDSLTHYSSAITSSHTSIPSPPPTAPLTTISPLPHPHFRRNHYTSPPPPRPQRHHLELDLARSLVCSLSSAAQGRHSGSRDSEPLGP